MQYTFQSKISNPVNESLVNFIQKACALNNFIFDATIVDKIEQLLAKINHNIGVILVGDTLTGKSSMLKILASTITLLEKVN